MSTPLKVERERRRLTTEQVAHAVGVKQPTINRIENGKKRPSPELCTRLAQFFGGQLTRDQIMYPEDYPTKASPARKTVDAARLF